MSDLVTNDKTWSQLVTPTSHLVTPGDIRLHFVTSDGTWSHVGRFVLPPPPPLSKTVKMNLTGSQYLTGHY